MEKLLSKAKVLEIVGLSFPTIWQAMRKGTFPRSVKLGDGAFTKIAWHQSEVEEWIRQRPRRRYLGDKKAPPPKGKKAK